MVTYQGRLRPQPSFEIKPILAVMAIVVATILGQVAYTIHLHNQLGMEKIGLVSCNAFLSDLEELETF